MLNKIITDLHNLNTSGHQLWQLTNLGYEELYKWVGTIATPLTLWLIARKVTLESAKQQNKASIEQNRQKILNDYLNQMTTLLIEKHLSLKPYGSPEALAAKALILFVLKELDIDRKKQVIQFLSDANLIQTPFSGSQPTLLRKANLCGFNLRGVNLNNADLQDAEMSCANLSCTFIENANLSNAYLMSTNLRGACLNKSNLKNACLVGADLSSIELNNSDLENADLRNTYISYADLRGANLSGIKLANVTLMKTDLSDANLAEVNLRSFDLDNLYLKRAKYAKNHPTFSDTLFPDGFNPTAAEMIKIDERSLSSKFKPSKN